MNKKTAYVIIVLFGVILTTSLVLPFVPGIAPSAGDDPEMTNYAEDQRAQFCGDGNSSSNAYITEYQIPTACTQPLGIAADIDGNIWFAETNRGGVGMFDPATGNFTEYENPTWPGGARSMFWDMAYSPDNSLWYTDELYDSVWRFSIDNQSFQRVSFPTQGFSLPQRIQIDGSQVLINDFTGGQMVFLDASGEGSVPLIIPSPFEQSLVSAFAKDSESIVWYTNWIPDSGGVLVRFDQPAYEEAVEAARGTSTQVLPEQHVLTYGLPPQAFAINGAVIDSNDVLWIMDTEASNFYRFDKEAGQFVQYVTSPVPEPSYGNHTGLVRTEPLSRPYWGALDPQGRIVFNEQAANRIAVFDPLTEKLVEYDVPTRNPAWADCADPVPCGIAQVFDFDIVGDKVWFTEWAANNIGVLDTSVQPPIDVQLISDQAAFEQNSTVTLAITATEDSVVRPVADAGFGRLITLVTETDELSVAAGTTEEVEYVLTASEGLRPREYKILVGAQTQDVAVSQFFTFSVGPPR